VSKSIPPYTHQANGLRAKSFRLVLGLLIFVSIADWSQALNLDFKDVQMEAYFSPGGGATEAVTGEISQAKSEVLVLAYSLSSQPIVKALLEAHRRGLAVKIILDKSERGEGLTPAVLLANAGASVLLDGRHGLAHSSCLIIDGQTVITGSFNYTKASEESNAEDLLIIRTPRLAKVYRDVWEKHRAHSETY
jgi:phosphatidylserine/phosphatidylglycerophosphate/cardiolipin synthase-like enzyme